MFKGAPRTSKVLPKEFRAIAEQLFPPAGFPEGEGPSPDAIKAFSAILSIGEEYRRFCENDKSGAVVENFLNRFQNNLDLLIQKTWVEKADEKRKEELLAEIPPFIALIESRDFPKALEKFGAILEGLAYLFFGAQSQSEDFAEYALRIDPQMGLFWWYGGQINNIQGAPWAKSIEPGVLRSLLFLGICYLTNF